MSLKSKRKSPLGNSGSILIVSETPRPGGMLGYTSLVSAIEAAKPNDRIEIAPGKYVEMASVLIAKPLDIYCEGPGTASFVSDSGFSIIAECYLEGINVKYGGSDDHAYAVVVLSGKTTLTNCEVENVSCKNDASLVMTQCKIIDSSTCGLFLGDQCKADVRSSLIRGHKGYCVKIETTEAVLLADNKISCSDTGQVLIIPPFSLKFAATHGELLTLRQNEIEDSSLGGGGGSHPVDARRCAVFATGLANVLFDRNHIHNGVRHGVTTSAGVKVQFDRNQFMNHKGVGLWIDGKPAHDFVDIGSNSFHGNDVAGLAVVGGAVVRAIGCDFGGHGETLVHVGGAASKVTIKDVAFRRGIIGVRVVDEAEAKLKDVQFEGMEEGVHSAHGAGVFVESCNFTDCKLCIRTTHGSVGKVWNNRFVINHLAVQQTTASRVIFTDNEFKGNAIGIEVSNGGRGVVRGNKFVDSRTSDVMILKYADPVIESNTFEGGGKSNAVVVRNYGRGLFRWNRFSEIEKCCIRVESFGDPLFDSNVITACHQEGVTVCDEGLGTFTNNIISDNQSGGVVVKTRGSPVFRNNHVSNNGSVGIEASLRASGLFEKNTISSNGDINVMMKLITHDGSTFRGNLIEGSPTGIFCTERGSGVLRQNVITKNTTGVHIECEANPLVLENAIYENTDGIVCSSGGLGVVCCNWIRRCLNGIMCSESCMPRIYGNHISHHSQYGISVCSMARGSIFHNVIEANVVAGLVLKDCETIVADNLIDGNGIGVMSNGSGECYLLRTLVCGNTLCGIHLSKETKINIENCIVLNEKTGVVCAEGGKGKMSNSFIGSCMVAVHATGQDTTTRFEWDTIMGTVIIKEGAHLSFQDTVFLVNLTPSIQSTLDAMSIIDRRLMWDPEKLKLDGVNFSNPPSPRGRLNVYAATSYTDVGALVVGLNGSVTAVGCVFRKVGIGAVLNDGHGALTKCCFVGCRLGVVCVGGSIASTVADCIMIRSSQCGILLTKQNKVSVTGCHILNGSGAGVIVTGHTNSNVKECFIYNHIITGNKTVSVGDLDVVVCESEDDTAIVPIETYLKGILSEDDVTGHGMVLSRGGSCEVTNSKMFGNARSAVISVQGGDPVLKGNKLYRSAYGVIVMYGGAGTYATNVLSQNTAAGLLCCLGGRGAFEGNTFRDQPLGVAAVWGGLTTLQGNTLFNHSIAGLRIEGINTRPVVSKNIIRNNTSGLVIRGKGCSPVVEHNTFTHNTQYGLHVSHGSAASCNNNTFSLHTVCGFITYCGATAFCDNNSFTDNATAVHVTLGATPTMKNNTFENTKDTAVFVEKQSAGLFQRNTFINSACHSVVVETGANPRFEDNKFEHETSVLVHNDGRGSFRANEFKGCIHTAFDVKNFGNPVIEGHAYINQKVPFLHCWQRAMGTVSGNFFFGNMVSSAVCFGDKCKTSFTKNMFVSHKTRAVQVQEGALPEYSGNTFANNSCAIELGTGALCALRGNCFLENNVCVFGGGCMGEITENVFWGTSDVCIALGLKATTAIGENTFSTCHRGIRLITGATSQIENNTFFNIGNVALELSEVNVKVSKCVIMGCEDGIIAHAQGTVVYVVDVSIQRATHAGIRVTGQAKLHVSGVSSIVCCENGVEYVKQGEGSLAKLLILGGNIGVHIAGKGNPVVTDCTILYHRKTGVLIGEGGLGTVQSCVLRANHDNVVVTSGSPMIPLFYANTICDAIGGAGVVLKDTAMGEFRDNKVYDNETAGIMCADAAAASFEGNHVWHPTGVTAFVRVETIRTRNNTVRNAALPGPGDVSGGSRESRLLGDAPMLTTIGTAMASDTIDLPQTSPAWQKLTEKAGEMIDIVKRYGLSLAPAEVSTTGTAAMATTTATVSAKTPSKPHHHRPSVMRTVSRTAKVAKLAKSIFPNNAQRRNTQNVLTDNAEAMRKLDLGPLLPPVVDELPPSHRIVLHRGVPALVGVMSPMVSEMLNTPQHGRWGTTTRMYDMQLRILNNSNHVLAEELFSLFRRYDRQRNGSLHFADAMAILNDVVSSSSAGNNNSNTPPLPPEAEVREAVRVSWQLLRLAYDEYMDPSHFETFIQHAHIKPFFPEGFFHFTL